MTLALKLALPGSVCRLPGLSLPGGGSQTRQPSSSFLPAELLLLLLVGAKPVGSRGDCGFPAAHGPHSCAS